MNSWFTVKVKYTKQLDDGSFKRVSEPYLLAAMTFTDAEARIYEELGALIRGEFIITGISRTDIHDIFHYEDSDVWYLSKVTFVTGDLDNPKPRKVVNKFLVTAHSVKEATERIRESMGGTLVDFDIVNTGVSPIVDVFPFGDEDTVTGIIEQRVPGANGETREPYSDYDGGDMEFSEEATEHVIGQRTVFSAANDDIDENHDLIYTGEGDEPDLNDLI